MLKYNVCPSLFKGELYTERPKTDKEYTSITSYYSFDPDDTGYSLDKIIDQRIDNFSDLENYLNYNVEPLRSKINKVAFSVFSDYWKRTPADISNDAIEDLKTSLASLHTFFSYYTEFHLYDLIIRTTISIISYTLNTAALGKKRKKRFIRIFSKVQRFWLGKLELDLDTYMIDKNIFFNYYSTKLEFEVYRNDYVPISRHYNIGDDIMHMRNFVVRLIPKKKYDKDNLDWKYFLLRCNNECTFFTLSPYSLTNHAKCQNSGSLLKVIQYNSLANQIKRAIAAFQQGEECSEENSNTDFTDESYPDPLKILCDSLDQNKYTYPIMSFKQFILAELHALINNGHSLKLCETCGNYFITGNNWKEHTCPPHTDKENSEKIRKIFNRKMYQINKHFDNYYSGQNSKRGHLDQGYYMQEFDDFKDYHKDSYYWALSHHISSSDYERFIFQEHLSLQQLDALLKFNSESDYEELDIKEKCIFDLKFRIPHFGEVIDLEAEKAEIEYLKHTILAYESKLS